MKSLEGLRVMDLSSAVVGPMYCMLLAEWGAEVTRVEFVEHEDAEVKELIQTGLMNHSQDRSSDGVNFNQPSLALHLKDRAGKRMLYQLLENTDLIITEYPSETLENLGLTYQELAPKFPGLVYGQIHVELYTERVGTADYAGNGNGAFALVNERVRAVPWQGFQDPLGISFMVDILAALVQRSRTGQGNQLETTFYFRPNPAPM